MPDLTRVVAALFEGEDLLSREAKQKEMQHLEQLRDCSPATPLMAKLPTLAG